MDYFSTLFDKKNMPQLVLSVLFVIYLVNYWTLTCTSLETKVFYHTSVP